MQVTVSTKITIAATTEEVFEYLTNLKYHYLWNPQVRSYSSKGKLQLGSVYRTESHILGTSIKSENKVISFKPPKELIIENLLGIVCYKARFRLSPQNSITCLTLSVTLSTEAKAFVFTKPILKQLAARELRTDLQALKVAVENKLV